MQSAHILRDFDQAISSLRSEVLMMAARTRHNLERITGTQYRTGKRSHRG